MYPMEDPLLAQQITWREFRNTREERKGREAGEEVCRYY